MSDMMLASHNLHKIYKNDSKAVKAVNGISLEVKKGESLAIVGPSGAGKSTLLHMLGGLDKPTEGHVKLDEIDVYKLPDNERAGIRNKRVGFVFQFYHLMPEFTALENVMLPALIARNSILNTQYSIQNKAKKILESVGLENRMNHKPSELSGGESQRVAIARALVNEPEILLCDEPTGNLDSKTSEAIYELLFDLKSKTTMALVIVTHDEKISLRIKRMVHIKDGKII